jgi:polyprenyl P-hydroxybenzoate/phenylacrylic acid decarboxylase-like protein
VGRSEWHEVGTDPAELGFPLHAWQDMTAPFASGSARYDAMIVVPCSAAGLARIAHGISADLVGRAADVMLKEKRPLVLVLRESPYNLILMRNMVAVAEAGATVIPASPSFYSRPRDLDARRIGLGRARATVGVGPRETLGWLLGQSAEHVPRSFVGALDRLDAACLVADPGVIEGWCLDQAGQKRRLGDR